MNIHLSTRLQAVADYIRPNSIMADIGTDHGQLIAYLAINDIIAKGYACDVNMLPLEKAWETISACKIEHKVELFLTNGLLRLDNKGITDIAIAGMGGELIGKIMGNADWIKDPSLNFVLQPMTRDHKLREYLVVEGFSIVEEKAVSCGKFLYSVMKVQYTGLKKQPTPHYTWSGELWEKNDRESVDYLKSRYTKLSLMQPSFKENDGYKELLEAWKVRLKNV